MRTAALGATALFVSALALPAAAAAPAPAVGALAATTAQPYSAYSSGDIVYANAANLPPVDVAKASTGQSAAGVGVHGGALVTADQLKQPLLAKPTAGKTAYGHGSALNVGLLGGVSDQPQVAQTLAEATSPAPSTATGGSTIPAAPLLTAHVLPGSAAANTTASGACVIGKDISNGASHVVDATVLDAGSAVVGTLGGTSDTASRTTLVQPTKADGSVVTTGKSGLLGETTLTLAPLTLFKGTPLEITIEALKDIRLSAAAGGVPGTSVVSYGAVGATGTTPVLKLTIGGQTQTLTAQQVFGGKGIVLALGAADVVIGAPAHSLTGLPGTSPTTAADGTSASAAADFVRVTVPGQLPVPTADPFDGPLSPLNTIVNPVLSGLSSALGPIQDALTSAGLDVADLRQGHLEASSAVPAGGIDCGSDDNPLNESRKDVSATAVTPGQTFTYAVRVPNRGTDPVTDVTVDDTYSAGLEFVSSVPAPASRGSHTLHYALGTLAPNAFRTVVMTFRAPADAPAGTVYHNDAVITGTYHGRTVTQPVAVDGPTVVTALSGGCNLSGSTKYASNTKVTPGETFGYFVNVFNSGDQPCTGVVVSDTLDNGVRFVSCTDGCAHSGQDVTWKLGTVAPGQSLVLGVLVDVVATSGTLPNSADVTPASGIPGHPSTPGPTVTTTSVARDGEPATLAGSGELPHTGTGELPHTGLPTGPAVAGVLLLLGAAAGLRRRTA
ncbi:MAG: hypothetical protein WCD35_09220 [Mycobacteriales bacterium]